MNEYDPTLYQSMISQIQHADAAQHEKARLEERRKAIELRKLRGEATLAEVLAAAERKRQAEVSPRSEVEVEAEATAREERRVQAVAAARPGKVPPPQVGGPK